MNIKRTSDSNQLKEFSELVAQSQSSLRAFIRSLGVKKEMVDDFAQETFLIAYKKFNQFDPNKASFPIWVKGIARYSILNETRKVARHNRLQNKFISDLLISDPVTMDNEKGDELIALNSCLSKLKDSVKSIIQKTYIENVNSQDLAESLGRKPSAIRQQLVRVRLILKNCINQTLNNSQ